MDEPLTVFSIGHSSLAYGEFLDALRTAEVTAIADVRSAPYSQRHPHFSREPLRVSLRTDGVAYAFLGDELGGRPRRSHLFCEGVADYERMAREPTFGVGLDRVLQGASQHRVALVCSEHDPLDCHRCLLVGRGLRARNVTVRHLLADGAQKTQEDVEADLLALAGQDRGQIDLFASPAERLAAAYRARARRVAFRVVEAMAAAE